MRESFRPDYHLLVGIMIGKSRECQNRDKSVPTHYLRAETFGAFPKLRLISSQQIQEVSLFSSKTHMRKIHTPHPLLQDAALVHTVLLFYNQVLKLLVSSFTCIFAKRRNNFFIKIFQCNQQEIWHLIIEVLY